MADIKEIVNVTITANTLSVSQKGFGTMLILGVNRAFPERIRFYNNLAGVAKDFSESDAEYQAAVLGFGQDIQPEQIAIGRVLTDSNAQLEISVANVSNNFNYIVYINGVKAEFTSSNASTHVNIASGLAASINALVPKTVVATPSGGFISLAKAPTYGDFGIKVGSKVIINQAVPSQSFEEALTDIESVSDDWYALVALTRLVKSNVVAFNSDFSPTGTVSISVDGQATPQIAFNIDQETTMQDLAEAVSNLSKVSSVSIVPDSLNRSLLISGLNGSSTSIIVVTGGTGTPTSTVSSATDQTLEIANWISARKKIFVTASADTAMLTSPDLTSVAAQLKSNNNPRSIVLYHQDAETTYPEAAWLGRMVPTQPGGATWMFKNLKGVNDSEISVDQSKNIRENDNANTYEIIGGIAITRDGITSSRQFIDIQVGIDWLEARIQERVYQRMTMLDKIPFTDAGIGVVEAELRAQLDQAVSVGLILDDYMIEVPKAANVLPTDKAIRLLPDVFFSATLQGAIHKVLINGTLSI